ncbi:hypothetical protein C7D71_30600, partial [Klebsiella pneumoniae]
DREPLEASGRLAAARSHPGVIKKSDFQEVAFFTDGGNYSAFGSSVWYFCRRLFDQLLQIVNRWKRLGGWPLPVATPE